MNPLASRRRFEQTVLGAAFFLLFPGFFYYHTLLGTGMMGAVLGGYFSPISLLFVLPLAFIYLRRMRRDPRQLGWVDLMFAMYLAYFGAVVVVHAATGANLLIVSAHLLEIMFLVNIYILFLFIDFADPGFRFPALLALAAMSAIAVIFSVDGVFYLGALGIAKDGDSLATYQGFARSYLITFLPVVAYTRSLPLRLALYVAGAVTLFLNTARSEFAALLFVAPIIEFYYSRHKLYFILAVILAGALARLYFDALLAALPDNRILELLDLSQSTSANKRHHLTLNALQTIRAHPLAGDYASYPPGYYSHNILSAWVDLGLFGFVWLCALMVLPAVPMFIREFFASRRSGNFMLGFSLAAVTVLLLLTSHYFTDMLIGATLGAYSKYLYERKYGKDRAPHLGPSTPRHADLHQAMPQFGGTRP
ncbi:hypothetical protein GCM10027321_30990 [Massilia terrae]|uniref:O-antigen ligase domain-containing protein n=1 Tax=Massilia terrae TaxID=1811224 RepID=A0ABT2D1C3_9BURK|nr:hypothetical protein [Massilia terrae]MCS0660022.1 hypothetical protein [Massilia terrae]